jgi:hypothetical protein
MLQPNGQNLCEKLDEAMDQRNRAVMRDFQRNLNLGE